MDREKLYMNIFKKMPVRDQRGASLVEYVLLVALIVVVVIAAITALGGGFAKDDSPRPQTVDAVCPEGYQLSRDKPGTCTLQED